MGGVGLENLVHHAFWAVVADEVDRVLGPALEKVGDREEHIVLVALAIDSCGDRRLGGAHRGCIAN